MSARLPKFVNVNNAPYARPLTCFTCISNWALVLLSPFCMWFKLRDEPRWRHLETNRFQQLSSRVKHVVVPGRVLLWLSYSAGSPTATPTKILTQVGRANAQVQTAELSHAPAQLHNCRCNKLELGRTRRHDEWMFGSISRRSVQVDNSHLDSARSARHEHQPQLS